MNILGFDGLVLIKKVNFIFVIWLLFCNFRNKATREQSFLPLDRDDRGRAEHRLRKICVLWYNSKSRL